MLFRRCLFFLAASYVTFSSAIPVPVDEDLSLARREPSDVDLNDVPLMPRANTMQIANKIVSSQEKRVAKKEEKRKVNAAIPGNAKEKNAAIRSAQKQQKAQRTAKWAAKSPPGPEGKKREIRPAKSEKRDQRKEAGKVVNAAAERMKNTENLPGRKTTHTVGTEQRSGRDVRQSVMLSHLNEKDPISHGKNNEYPKVIKPYANPNYERDTKAAGQYVVPKEGVREYPVKQNGGWTGGKPGLVRSLTSVSGQDKLEAVVGHDTTKKGSSSKGHVEAVQSRELDVLDLEY
jgi:hypothetical protein